MKSKGEKHIAAALVIFVFGVLFMPCEICKMADVNSEIRTKTAVFKPVIDSLLDMGIDSAFIFALVRKPEVQFDEKYVKINVTGYLKKADYSHNYNRKSIKRCKKFYKANKGILKQAEANYGVPARIITAILWVETKFGGYLGRHNIAGVYLSTALSNRYESIQMNLRELDKNKKIKAADKDSLRQRVYERAEKKSLWAKRQLLYLDSSRSKLPTKVSELRGSWAGAFGMAQFIPSSYYRWAVDGNQDDKIDLFDKTDAIFSVANYLYSNGWTSDFKDKRKALHHYNNSDDYVNAILILASRI